MAQACCDAKSGSGDAHTHRKATIGIGPYKIPSSMYIGNRQRLLDRFSRIANTPGNSAMILQGGKDMMVYDTDGEMLFRQESFFYYLFGVNEPNLYGAIDIATKQSILFVPRLGSEYEVWCGPKPTHAMYQDKFGVDAVHYVDEMTSVLQARHIKVLHVISGRNTDSGSDFVEPKFEGMDEFAVERGFLHRELVECRVIKSAEEIDLLRYVVGLSSKAHTEVMKQMKPGMAEYQGEAIFRHYATMHGGSRYVAYTCICGSGKNGAVLHYGHAGAPNDKLIDAQDMLLFDMGAEYQGYCSDITCSFPASGKFSDDHRQVYEAVLAAQRAVEAAMKPKVKWTDMHRLAERTILEHLVKHQFVVPHGKTLEELHALHIPAIFMPHGLGHFMGLDTHDVGGYPAGIERPKEPGICKLRTARELEAGMVITVEPGCYFIDALLDRAAADPKQAPHLNMDKIAKFRGFGGVRLEDDVVVTADGIENLTKVPRTVEEVEKVMASGGK